MATTLNRLYPYPDGPTSPNNVPYDLQRLAEAVDVDVKGLATTSASNTTKINALAVTAWTNLPLASGWVTLSGSQPIQYRHSGIMTEITGGYLTRSVALSVGTAIETTFGTLPAGFRPALPETGVGAVGVAGNLGATAQRIQATGAVQFSAFIAGGTMANTGGYSNCLIVSAMSFETP